MNHPIKYANGQTETLALRELSITELYQFIDLVAAGKTPDIIALTCDRNLAWVNSLDLDCFADLAAACFKENFRKAVRIAEKDPIAGLKIAPFRLESLRQSLSAVELASTVTPPAAASSGNGSPPTPPPTASAAPIPPAPSPILPASSAATLPPANVSAPATAST